MTVTTATVADYWREMVTAALPGTDRGEAQAPPTGGLADLAADDPQPTPSQRLLQQVAGCTVAQRAGLLPTARAPLIAPPDDDPRPVTPPSATATWQRIKSDWPLLEDEWMLPVIHPGRRLSPELVVPVLARHRTDATRHARALVAAGPLGRWMMERAPRLQCTARLHASMESIGELPELAIVPDLLPVLSAPPERAARTIVAGLASGVFATSHRAVLAHLLARSAPPSLAALADGIGSSDPAVPTIGLAFALADLARLRHHMLT